MVWNLRCSLFFSRLEVSVQFRDRKNFGGKILALAGWGWCGNLDGLNSGIDCGFKAVQNGGSITTYKHEISCVVYEQPVHDMRGIGAVLFALQMNFRSECNDEA